MSWVRYTNGPSWDVVGHILQTVHSKVTHIVSTVHLFVLMKMSMLHRITPSMNVVQANNDYSTYWLCTEVILIVLFPPPPFYRYFL